MIKREKLYRLVELCRNAVSGEECSFGAWLIGTEKELNSKNTCEIIVHALMRTNPEYFVRSVAYWLIHEVTKGDE